MPQQGQVIENPVTGERAEFRTTADDSAGRSLQFDYYLQPDGFAVGRIDHVHPNQEERFEVRAGKLGVRIDGDEWTATPGTRFAVLPETPHTVWNAGEEEMHAVVEIRPALNIEYFFETMFGLARDGKTNGMGLPNPLQLAVVANAFRDEFSIGGVPLSVQRALASMAAPVGRLVGYRASYPQYSDVSSGGTGSVRSGSIKRRL